MKKIAVIGGGAAGTSCAIFLRRKGCAVTIFERGERLGRKLSATGNGQGNVTNIDMDARHYFSDDPEKVARALARFGAEDTIRFLESIGGIFLPDGRGRVYPAGRQASAVTDLLRGELARLGTEVKLNARVTDLKAVEGRTKGAFRVVWEGGAGEYDAVVLAAGGRAAPNFGTDGSAYALAEKFGHRISPCSPRLVKLKSDPAAVRGLKGIRADAGLSVVRGQKVLFRTRGDVLFTDCGVSGDAVFRASSHAETGDVLLVDLLPDVPSERLCAVFAKGGEERLLCVVNNALGRALWRRTHDPEALAALVKGFPVPVTGTLGFREAQVTRGGVPLKETDEYFMSKLVDGLFFAGEILDADGECGGYNLQWAFTSAFLAAEGAAR